ncbi:hypothetical protein IEO21_02937 [Rhodonia placenta]|uniref:Zn(2)-C6 fungal-type domain-containing protein n=1 Tax=Rhodonia placenta TaxID=104341 RepID=A0A8H7P6N6_9APHY|nr:hypothetical protein IEO21_02937 [Postia placenta]
MSSEQDVMGFDLDYLAMLQAVPLEYEYGMQIYWEPTSNPYSELLDLNVLYTPERPVRSKFQQELSADSHSLEFCSQGSEYYSPEMFSVSNMNVAMGHEAVASIDSANRQYTVYSVNTAEPIGTQSGALPEMPNHKRPFKRTTALACVFCRKRKIACGGPVPGDKACK